MTKERKTNVAASVRQRLLNLSRERKEDFQAVLTRYVLERLLYRLEKSGYGKDFTLKGAMLFAVWTGEPHRATWDLDLLGRGSPDIPRLEEIFRQICVAQVEDDGVAFDPASVNAEPIREEQEYEGIRVKLTARLEAARVTVQVDVGFGDAIIPSPEEITYPTLLDFPGPRLRAYPKETVVAEKLEAMVARGMTNSRMKDFYDVWVLANTFPFKGQVLAEAIRATFERRKTPLPVEEPLALSDSFQHEAARETQWRAFLRKGRLEPAPLSLVGVIPLLREFLLPPLAAARDAKPFKEEWRPKGPWG